MRGDVFVEGGFGPLEMIETGSVDQEIYINILISRFHSWFTHVAVHQEKGFIYQGDGASLSYWWKETHQIRGFEYCPAQSPD